MKSKANFIKGTLGNDKQSRALLGSDEDDDVYGFAGDDELSGNDGDDWLFPGSGGNIIDGGRNSSYERIGGPDIRIPIRGVTAGDLLSYQDLNVSVYISLTSGSGTARHGDSVDIVSGIENVAGTKFDDIIEVTNEANGYFTAPAAVVEGGGGNDIIRGGPSNDILDGESGGAKKGGNDELHGFFGADTLYDSPGNDLLDGGDDYGDSPQFRLTDKAIFERVVQVNLVEGIARHGKSVEVDQLVGIEDLTIAAGSTAIGDANGNQFASLAGKTKNATTFFGGDDNDNFLGGPGSDIMYGEAGNDNFYFNSNSLDKAKSGRDFVMDFVRGEDRIIRYYPDLFEEFDTNKNGILDALDTNVRVGDVRVGSEVANSTELLVVAGSSLVIFGIVDITANDLLGIYAPT